MGNQDPAGGVIHTPDLPRFELRRFLGRGALGDVYLAWDREGLQEVALKLVRIAAVPADMLDAEKNGSQLQQRLAAVAPQVPAVFATGEENGIFWIAMEFIDGMDLADALDAGRFTEPRAVRIAIELCDFLHALHELKADIGGRTIQGIVHGDLKPENLRLLADDRVRVLDFGIARQLSISRSFTHQPFGSLPYISPERLETGEVTRASDLWSVGVLLYVMVAGSLPFAGTAPADLEQNIRRGARLPLTGSCSPGLSAILDRCLHIEMGRRYPSAAALKQDLEAFLDGRPVLPLPRETAHATRRTRPPAAPTRRGRHAATQGLATALGLFATFGACQGYVRVEARNLRQDLVSSTDSGVEALWRRYRGINRIDLLGLVPVELGHDMRAALLRSADRVLSRDPELPGTREDWEAARVHLEAALEIDGTDTVAQAKLAYCRAQIALAEAVSFQEAGDAAAAARRKEDALAELARAAGFDAAWPQPHAIRARIYSESEPVDLVRLEAELAAAEARGYPAARLIPLRAAGHYAEAQRLYSEALRFRGSDRERDLLASAIESFSRAIDLYDRVPVGSQAEHTRATALRTRQILEDRYAALALPW